MRTKRIGCSVSFSGGRRTKPGHCVFMIFEEIRKNQETMDMTAAVDKAIADMPAEFEIREFLKNHQSEVANMCLTEYNEAETMQLFKEEGKEEGREEGEEIHLIRLVCRKLRKGKNPAEIANELEEDEAKVQAICNAADQFAPEYNETLVISSALQRF